MKLSTWIPTSGSLLAILTLASFSVTGTQAAPPDDRRKASNPLFKPPKLQRQNAFLHKVACFPGNSGPGRVTKSGDSSRQHGNNRPGRPLSMSTEAHPAELPLAQDESQAGENSRGVCNPYMTPAMYGNSMDVFMSKEVGRTKQSNAADREARYIQMTAKPGTGVRSIFASDMDEKIPVTIGLDQISSRTAVVLISWQAAWVMDLGDLSKESLEEWSKSVLPALEKGKGPGNPEHVNGLDEVSRYMGNKGYHEQDDVWIITPEFPTGGPVAERLEMVKEKINKALEIKDVKPGDFQQKPPTVSVYTYKKPAQPPSENNFVGKLLLQWGPRNLEPNYGKSPADARDAMVPFRLWFQDKPVFFSRHSSEEKTGSADAAATKDQKP
jgi:hypothetical protein